MIPRALWCNFIPSILFYLRCYRYFDAVGGGGGGCSGFVVGGGGVAVAGGGGVFVAVVGVVVGESWGNVFVSTHAHSRTRCRTPKRFGFRKFETTSLTSSPFWNPITTVGYS